MRRGMFLTAGIAAVLALNGATAEQESTSKLPASPREVCPLLVGEPVPEVGLETAAGEAIDLQTAIAARPTILIFYRGGW